MDNIFVIFFYINIIALIFAGLIAVGCLISKEFKQDFLNDWRK